MGMFDWVICEYPLPGENINVPSDHRFQTKDFECCMSTYRITPDGRLVDQDEAGEHVNFTGELRFWDSNIVGSGSIGVFTATGEDAVECEYGARFIEGLVQEISQVEFQTVPALPVSQMCESDARSKYIEYV